MKKLCLLLSLLLLFSLSGCLFSATTDEAIASLGRIETKNFYSSGDFQDFTDYAKYTFTEPDLEDNKYFRPMSEKDLPIFEAYLEDFEQWVSVTSTGDLTENYDFDRSIIDGADYFYLYEDPEYPIHNGICGSYNIYFFDTQTEVLYYFHNNI